MANPVYFDTRDGCTWLGAGMGAMYLFFTDQTDPSDTRKLSCQFYKDKSPNGADYVFPLPYDNIIPKIFSKIQSADYCSGHVAAYLRTHDEKCFGSDAKRIRIRENDCRIRENDSFRIVLLLFSLKMIQNDVKRSKNNAFSCETTAKQFGMTEND